jgi:hypothetical protein
MGTRGIAPGKESYMDKQTCKNHIMTLMKVRDECESQLDSGVKAELDDVIDSLNKHLDGGLTVMEVFALTSRVLEVIASVVNTVTKISDWF